MLYILLIYQIRQTNPKVDVKECQQAGEFSVCVYDIPGIRTLGVCF